MRSGRPTHRVSSPAPAETPTIIYIKKESKKKEEGSGKYLGGSLRRRGPGRGARLPCENRLSGISPTPKSPKSLVIDRFAAPEARRSGREGAAGAFCRSASRFCQNERREFGCRKQVHFGEVWGQEEGLGYLAKIDFPGFCLPQNRRKAL